MDYGTKITIVTTNKNCNEERENKNCRLIYTLDVIARPLASGLTGGCVCARSLPVECSVGRSTDGLALLKALENVGIASSLTLDHLIGRTDGGRKFAKLPLLL